MTPSFLEIALHLSNGRTHRFVQNDPALAQATLRQINSKVFAQPSLIITGNNRSAAYAARSLVGISFNTQTVPEELLRAGSLPFVPSEITQNDYHAKQPKMTSRVAGEPGDTLVEVEFSNGYHLWLEARVPHISSPMEQRHRLHNIFSSPTLLCHNLGGGLSLWNVAQMASCCLSPELDAPANAWTADFVS